MIARVPLSALDGFYALVLAAASALALLHGNDIFDGVEKILLIISSSTLIGLGWNWRGLRNLIAISTLAALAAIALYQSQIARGEQLFVLKYLLGSQVAILWMGVLTLLATGAYWLGPWVRAAGRVGTALCWIATGAGLTGMLVRWHESYLISPGAGHIPLANLYEVLVLFCVVTQLITLFFESRHPTRKLGGFVLPVVSAAFLLLFWSAIDRGAHEIQPLVPALQSSWMKIHVPACFVGYGAFTVAAMAGLASLLSRHGMIASRWSRTEELDDLIYRAIATGFPFFTLATVFGAFWANEAWGSYWQWDPKETWALIVWLNYAAWLHLRMNKPQSRTILAWWAMLGFFVTSFSFLGVNLLFKGLHSYASL